MQFPAMAEILNTPTGRGGGGGGKKCHMKLNSFLELNPTFKVFLEVKHTANNP